MKYSFKAIAGYDEEKKELKELSNLILNHNELEKIGGSLPRGVLLCGPSGVGKTYLAKALISTSKCRHVEINYNDINSDEEFLPYIKSKFAEAAKELPCILFIDEFDKLLAGEKNFFSNGSDVEKTRIFANEINKYNEEQGLFILLVANNRRSIDPSLLRSGRIDKIIEIGLPSEKERKEIFNYFTSNVVFRGNINIDKICKKINGYSGADIKCLVNNSIIKAFNEKNSAISEKNIMDSYYDNLFKTYTKDLKIDDAKLKELAYHEAGHTVLAILTDPDNVAYASIKPRGDCLGFVSTDQEEVSANSLDERRNTICIALAGRAAEQTYLNSTTAGCLSDLARAKMLAASIVRGGMMGLRYLDLSTLNLPVETSPSGARLAEIEKEEDAILNCCENIARNLIHEYHSLFNNVVDKLMEKRNLNREDIEDIIDEFKVKELDASAYRTIKERIGMYNRVNAFDLCDRFNIGYYQAQIILKRLQDDKYVGSRFNSNGYEILVR